jgi:hypothetical protein
MLSWGLASDYFVYMTFIRKLRGWQFWRQWYLANCLGIALPPTIAWALFWAYGYFIGLLLIPISLGIAQSLVLREILPGLSLWAVVTILGCLVGGLCFSLLLSFTAGSSGILLYLQFLIALLAFGSSVGLAQWLRLRSQLARAHWWILANMIAVPLAAIPQLAAFYLLSTLGQAIIYTGSGAIYATVTGVCLIWLITEP